MAKQSKQISVARIRIAVVLFVLWWLPIYLAAPAIARALGYDNDPHAAGIVTLVIIIVQTAIGLLGVGLAGKELASTLRSVRFKKLPVVVWKIIWSGDTTVDRDYLKHPPANS